MTAVLVDTSVWIDHFRRGNARLEALLQDGSVVCHPLVIGELACGNIRDRGEVLSLFSSLPQTPGAEHDEVIAFIEAQHLWGRGLGWIDVNMLASACLARVALWTLDRQLHDAADGLGVAAVLSASSTPPQ